MFGPSLFSLVLLALLPVPLPVLTLGHCVRFNSVQLPWSCLGTGYKPEKCVLYLKGFVPSGLLSECCPRTQMACFFFSIDLDKCRASTWPSPLNSIILHMLIAPQMNPLGWHIVREKAKQYKTLRCWVLPHSNLLPHT